MTREEAIEVLQQDIPCEHDTDLIEALEMAIQALSQEPSREFEDYENEIEDLHNRLDIAEYDKERLREEVTNLEAKIQALSQEPMREFTEEEAKAYSKALDKMYKPTGFNVFNEPCDDAISREAVCNIVNDIRDCISVEGYWAILERLKKLPPVTQKSETVTEFADRCRECGARYGKLLKQKSGKWIYQEGYVPYKWKCNQCSAEFKTDFNFCPNCGAKMEG
jgi:DNA-directed RNA polymerase subunit RPC12/RpoP